MLPLGNRPVVDYAVQDCIAAGIRDIYFVVSEQSTQIRDFYRSNVDLNNYLRRNGKADLLPLIALHGAVELWQVRHSHPGEPRGAAARPGRAGGRADGR